MRDERGFALVSVLWTLVILTLLAGLAMQTTRTSTLLERNQWHRMQAEAAAETAFTRAVLSLLDKRANRRWPLDGRPVDMTIDGLKVRATIQDELGRIDLNTAPHDLLAGVFAIAGMSDEAAQSLADDALAWRQNPNFDRSGILGPTRAGSAIDRLHGPFLGIDELRLLPGVTDTVFDALRPGLTVYSRRPTIDPATAPRLVLLALPGSNRQSVDDILRQRGTVSQEIDSKAGLAAAPLAGRAFTIEIEVERNGAPAFRQERTIRLLPPGKPPYWVLNAR